MISILTLVLSATQVLAQAAFTVEPSTITAGEYATINITLSGRYECSKDQYPVIKLKLKERMKGVILYRSNHSLAFVDQAKQFRYMMLGPPGGEVYLYDKANVIDKFQSSFDFFSLNPTTVPLLEISVACHHPAELRGNPQQTLLPKQNLNIHVIASPALAEVAKLTPAEVNSTTLSDLVLSAPWPEPCRLSRRAVIKLSLNPDTIKDGGALSATPNSEYIINGIKGDSKEQIKVNKPKDAIKKDSFTAIEFIRNSFILHNQSNLTFKFLAQQVPETKSIDTQIDVQFICGNSAVKIYSKDGGNAPTLKVNRATSTSLALSALLFASLLCFL